MEKGYRNGETDKIELVGCKFNGKNCKNHLTDINKKFADSALYHQNKEYQMSINSLKTAFDKTYELSENTCSECARLFRSTIIQSLENIQGELHRMSNGVFRSKQYRGSYVFAKNVLNEIKEEN